jgi:hypothetical protein
MRKGMNAGAKRPGGRPGDTPASDPDLPGTCSGNLTSDATGNGRWCGSVDSSVIHWWRARESLVITLNEPSNRSCKFLVHGSGNGTYRAWIVGIGSWCYVSTLASPAYKISSLCFYPYYSRSTKTSISNGVLLGWITLTCLSPTFSEKISCQRF